LGLALSLGGRVIFESHDDRLYAGNVLVNRLMVRSTVRKSRHPRLALFLTISQALADRWAKRNVSADKMLALHDGVSRDALSYEMAPDDARRELGLPLDRSIVVYAGSLKADRKPERLWRLARAFPDALFVVVGGEPEQVDRYRSGAQAAGAGNIRWVGRVPHSHVRRYLAAGEVLLMLWSWDVGTIHVCSPLKVFEYMAAGRTIVGEAFPTIGEVLVHEQTALLASPGDFESLRACLGIAISGDRLQHLGQRARQEAERYSWDRRCQQILSALTGAGDAAFPGTAHTV
jgi:glycosyltransferase involved in cell wall biosynthesis